MFARGFVHRLLVLLGKRAFLLSGASTVGNSTSKGRMLKYGWSRNIRSGTAATWKSLLWVSGAPPLFDALFGPKRCVQESYI